MLDWVPIFCCFVHLHWGRILENWRKWNSVVLKRSIFLKFCVIKLLDRILNILICKSGHFYQFLFLYMSWVWIFVWILCFCKVCCGAKHLCLDPIISPGTYLKWLIKWAYLFILRAEPIFIHFRLLLAKIAFCKIQIWAQRAKFIQIYLLPLRQHFWYKIEIFVLPIKSQGVIFSFSIICLFVSKFSTFFWLILIFEIWQFFCCFKVILYFFVVLGYFLNQIIYFRILRLISPRIIFNYVQIWILDLQGRFKRSGFFS